LLREHWLWWRRKVWSRTLFSLPPENEIVSPSRLWTSFSKGCAVATLSFDAA
jgi:hypothetical protein